MWEGPGGDRLTKKCQAEKDKYLGDFIYMWKVKKQNKIWTNETDV